MCQPTHISGSMDNRGKERTHQCARAISYPEWFESVYSKSPPDDDSNIQRQHDGGASIGKVGIHPIRSAKSVGNEYLELGSGTPIVLKDSAYSREREWSGRSSISSFPGPSQLEIEALFVSDDSGDLGSPRRGSVCGQIQSSTTTIHQLATGGGGSRDRRFASGLVTVEKPLRVSTVCFDSSSVAGPSGTEGSDHAGGTELDNSTVVSNGPSYVEGSATSATILTADVIGRSTATTPVGGESTVTSLGMSHRFESNISKGFSPAASLLLTQDIRESTRKVYNSQFKRWELFCQDRDIAAFNPTIMDICNFLALLQTRDGLSFSTINTYKCAILASLPTENVFSTVDLRYVSKLLKSCRLKHPPHAKYSTTWKIDAVLDNLVSWGPNSLLTEEKLTSKVVFLIAAVGVLRVSELAKLSFIPAQKLSNAWILNIMRWKKNTRAGINRAPSVTLPSFEDNPLLCPVLCLEHYLERTVCWRQQKVLELFLILAPPHRLASRDTLGRWLKRLKRC
jgi:hypothetical protein